MTASPPEIPAPSLPVPQLASVAGLPKPSLPVAWLASVPGLLVAWLASVPGLLVAWLVSVRGLPVPGLPVARLASVAGLPVAPVVCGVWPVPVSGLIPVARVHAGVLVAAACGWRAEGDDVLSVVLRQGSRVRSRS
jgi:hypothetical protein